MTVFYVIYGTNKHYHKIDCTTRKHAEAVFDNLRFDNEVDEMQWKALMGKTPDRTRPVQYRYHEIGPYGWERQSWRKGE